MNRYRVCIMTLAACALFRAANVLNNRLMTHDEALSRLSFIIFL